MEKIVKISGMDALVDFLRRMDEELTVVSPVKVHGTMRAILYRDNGDIVVTQKGNIIVAGGFDFIADALCNSASRPAVMSQIAVGTGTTGSALAQTQLVTETLRKAATYAHTAGTQVFTMASTFAAGEATGALTEAGVFNAATNGTMLDRVVFGVINKGANDTLTQTFSFSMS